MLTIIEGGFASPISATLIEKIRTATASGSRTYLIVPEQQTVLAECTMSRVLTSDAPLTFEVTNFTRFANTVFREMGGISGEYCSPVIKSLTMWRTLFELSPELAMTERDRGISDGTVRRALSAITEMQMQGITPEDITEVLTKDIPSARLKTKLFDLSRIYSAYTAHIGEGYQDTANDMAALYEILLLHPEYLSDCEIFIDGFTSFTAPQYKVIEALIRSSSVTVSLLSHPLADFLFEFKEVKDTKLRLTTCADRCGVAKRQIKLRELRQGHAPVLSELADLLWRSDGEIDNESLQFLADGGGRVRIFRSTTAYEECAFIAADIKRRVTDGDNYSDFAIVAADATSYDGILDAALDTEGIPYFFSRHGDLGNTAVVKLIGSAYSAVIFGWRREDILSYLKSGLSGLSDDARDKLELYIEKWGIDKRRFEEKGAWDMHPDGYDARDKDIEGALSEINGARDAVMAPLMKFRAAVNAAATVKEHATALIGLLTELRTEELLLVRATELSALGEEELAEESRQIWGAICDALDAVVEVLAELELSPLEFLSQLRVALNGAVIGRIPAYADVVTVGSADMLRLGGKKHVYLMGVNEGEFPRTVSDGSYFGEQEKIELSLLGLPIDCDLEMRGARELYSFSRAFSIADETVTLTYAEKTAMLTALLPSEVISRIGIITHGKVAPKSTRDIPARELIFSPGAALEGLGLFSGEEYSEVKSALSKSGFGDAIAISEGKIANDNLTVSSDVLGLLFRGDLYLSQTRIDKFLGCPMSYFCEYTLKLNDREPAELGANIIGSFVHAVLENFFSEVKERGLRVAEIDEGERENIARRSAKAYTDELLGGTAPDKRTELALSRLVRATKPVIDGICDELGGALYEPAFFELETDPYDPKAPNHVVIEDENGLRTVIRGTIDRVDTYKSGDDVYVRVVDYKTGHNEFLPSKLKDGEYLQMFLYLKAIADSDKPGFRDRLGVGEGGKIIPAGVIYVKTKVRDTFVRYSDDSAAEESVKEIQKRDGMVLSDPVSIDAMNPDFMPPVPTARSRSFEPREYDMDGWHEIENTLRDVVLSVSDGMRSGNIKATPATKGGRNCKWCKFKSVCRAAVIKNDF